MKFQPISISIISLLLILSCQNNSKVTVKGNINNSEGEILYFQHVKANATVSIDSVNLKQSGTFKFKTPTETPGFYQLKIKNTGSISLLLNPGDDVNIKANADSLLATTTITGSEESEKLLYLNKSLAKVRAEIKEISEDSINFDEKWIGLSKAYRKEIIGFILQNTNSLTSISAIYQQYYPNFYVFNSGRDIQYFKILRDSLVKYFPNSPHVMALKQNTDNMIRNYNSAKLNDLIAQSDIGNHLPDITMKDTKGTLRSLHEINKLVLLTFWNHTEQSCIQYNLQLKPVYEKYKNKGFEIYEVSVSSDSSAWQAAVRYDELNWINVWGPEPELADALNSYNVQSIPRSILLTADKTDVLATDISAIELDRKLNGLLN